MVRFAEERRTVVVEPAIYDAARFCSRLDRTKLGKVLVCTPHLSASAKNDPGGELQLLLDGLIDEQQLRPQILWYEDASALRWSRHLRAPLVVYDHVTGVSPDGAATRGLERELIGRAGLMFVDNHSAQQAKSASRRTIHLVPSVAPASPKPGTPPREPADQRAIATPIRIGCVIDDVHRVSWSLIQRVGAALPQVALVVIGPSFAEAELPSNVHVLGPKPEARLPAYVAGWRAAMLPYEHDEGPCSGQLERALGYLAAGLPVVTTPLSDVVALLGRPGLVRVAHGATFAEAVESSLTQNADQRNRQVAAFLAQYSWSAVFRRMQELVQAALQTETASPSDNTVAI